jgi:hypothetical protein
MKPKPAPQPDPVTPARILWLLTIPAILNLAYLWFQIGNPGDTSMPESLIVYGMQRMNSGQTLYLDFHQAPFNYMPYTPLYSWIVAHLGRIAQWGSLFMIGRIFTFGCVLILTAILYVNARRQYGRTLIAASGGLLLLGSTLLWQWSVTARPDVLAILLSICGLLIWIRAENSMKRAVACLFFILAFLAKQSAIAAPLSVLAFSFAKRQTRPALELLVCWLLPVLALFALMHWTTGGLSTLNIIGSNRAPMNFANLRLTGVLFLQAAALPLILAILAIPAKEWMHPEVFYFLISTAFASVSASKLGSNVNYFLEPLAAAALLAPHAIWWILRSPVGKALLIAMILVLTIPPVSFILYGLTHANFHNEFEIRGIVSKTTTPLLTDSPRLAFESKQQFLIDPFALTYLEREGKWNSTPVAEMVDRKEFQYVILTLPVENPSSWQGSKRLPDKVLESIRKQYRFDRILDDYYVYVPN